MTAVRHHVTPAALRFLGETQLLVDEELLMQELAWLGEKEEEHTESPIEIFFVPELTGFLGRTHPPTNRHPNRQILVSLGEAPNFGHDLLNNLRFFVKPVLRKHSASLVNAILLHELVHAADFTDEKLVDANADYVNSMQSKRALLRHFGRLSISEEKYFKIKLESPFEEHAYAYEAHLQKEDSVPQFVRFIEKHGKKD
jgi:hypothetical protein